MKLLKWWTNFEKILLFGSMLAIIIVGIIFKSDLLTVSCSVMWVLTALLLAKGNNLCRFFGVVSVILYSYLSFNNQFYWEVLVRALFVLPMDVLWIISWIRNKDDETNFVKINFIKRKEWTLSSVLFLFVFVWIYYLLKFFNTNELVISTISVMFTLFAIYLQIRRCKYSFMFFLFCDVILIILWGVYVFQGNIALLPIFLNSVILCINDAYGFYNWWKVEKLQEASGN